MIDGIIKGDGTSRLLAGSLPATYEEFRQLAAENKLPVDLLLNTEGWSQLPTFLNKANLFSDPTAEKYPDGIDTPNKAFDLLGGLTGHAWKRREKRSFWKEKVQNANVKMPIAYIGRADLTDELYETRYSDSYHISDDGYVVLDEPVGSAFVSINNRNETGPALRGKYAIQYSNTGKNSKSFYHINEDSPIEYTGGVPGYVYMTGTFYIIEFITEYSDWEYVFSQDRHAYPDSGEQDSYEYIYLGMPFENAIEAPKIEVGSYIGTGTYGQSSPTKITFSAPPKAAIVFDERYDTLDSAAKGLIWVGNSGTRAISLNGNTLSYWYASSAAAQLNEKGIKYNYVGLL